MNKLPISLKIALAIFVLRLGGGLLVSVLQFTFVLHPPTSGFWFELWAGMKASLGDNANNPGYVLGLWIAGAFPWLPFVPTLLWRSKFWLIVTRVFLILGLFGNIGSQDFMGALMPLIMIFLLFSKGAKAYVAKPDVSK